MINRRRGPNEPAELLQIVLDDATIARLRHAADMRGIDVEQLIVEVIHAASLQIEARSP